MKFALAISALLFAAGLGCSSRREQPPPVAMRVTTSDGAEMQGEPAVLEVSSANQTDVDLALAAQREGVRWAARTRISRSELHPGKLAFEVKQARPGPGLATVEMWKGWQPEFARNGQITLVLQHGVVKGEARTSPDHLSAKFQGRFVVRCLVPADQLPSANATGGVTGGPVLVADEKLETPSCRRFKELL